MAVDAWIKEQQGEGSLLSDQGLEMKASDNSSGAEIVPIKSCKIEGALQLQLYIERKKPTD
jgi:hypothetical protein